MFSLHLFEQENIFKEKKRNIEHIRSDLNKYKRQTSPEKEDESGKRSKSVDRAAKRMPPNIKDNLTTEEIQMYQQFGQYGWQFFYDQLLNIKNKSLMNHITFLYR